jgi:hypothetical protein
MRNVDYEKSKPDGSTRRGESPLTRLPREDLELITELVLQSGSLKGLAKAYGVSYPTIRGRLDKVIERLRGLIEGRVPDPVSDLLASLVERGELSTGGARRLQELIREERTRTPRREPESKPEGESLGAMGGVR